MLVFFVLLDYLFRSVEKENFFCGISTPPAFFFLVVFVPYTVFSALTTLQHTEPRTAQISINFLVIYKKGSEGAFGKAGVMGSTHGVIPYVHGQGHLLYYHLLL